MRLIWSLIALLSLSGCNAVHFNHWLLRKRYARAGIDEHYVQLPSGRMRYFEGGQGPPLLLLHGFGYGAVENWSGQVAAFSKHRRVIAPDMYWFGASVPTSKIETAAAETEALIELMDALRIERADFVGASFGGLIELHLALRHPERIDRLVFVDSAGLKPTRDEELRIQANFGGHHTIAELLMPTDVKELRSFLERVVYRHRPMFPDWVLRQVIGELGRNREPKTKLCASLHDELFDADELARIRARTLVVWGRNDPLLLVSMGERMARAIPGASLVVIEDGAHSVMLEKAARFNALVVRFLDGPSTSGLHATAPTAASR